MAISRRHFLALGGAAIVTGGVGASGLADAFARAPVRRLPVPAQCQAHRPR